MLYPIQNLTAAREQLERGVSASEIARSWLPAVAEFNRVRERFLLY